MNFDKIFFILLMGIFKTTIFAAEEEKGTLYFEQPCAYVFELCSKFPSFQLENENLKADNKRLNEILKPFMAIEVSILPH